MKSIKMFITILVSIVLLGCSQNINKATSTMVKSTADLSQNTVTIETTKTLGTLVPSSSPPSSATPSSDLMSLLLNPAELPPGQYLVLWVSYYKGNNIFEDYVGLLSSNDQSLKLWIKVNRSSPYQWLSLDGSTVVIGSSLDSDPSYLIDIQSGDVIALNALSGCLSANLSPDGQKLIAACYSDNLSKAEIYLIDLETKSKTKLTDCYPEICVSPKWSPSGDFIAYIRAKQSNGNLTPSEGAYLLDVNCAVSSDCKKQNIGPFHNGYAIAWSPNDAYLSVGGWNNTIDSHPKLFIYKVYGQNLNPDKTFDLDQVFNMAWSPDGKFIAYNSDSSVYVFSLDTGKVFFQKDLHIAGAKVLGWLIIP